MFVTKIYSKFMYMLEFMLVTYQKKKQKQQKKPKESSDLLCCH